MSSAGAAMEEEVAVALTVDTESGSDLDEKQAAPTEEEPKIGPDDSASALSQGGKSHGSAKPKETFRQEYRVGNAEMKKAIEEVKEDAKMTQEKIKMVQEEFRKELKEKIEEEKEERMNMTKKHEDKEKELTEKLEEMQKKTK